jgi:hypothetical protein
VFFADIIAFTSLTANGSATETTTILTLTFNWDITGLNAEDITLSGNTGANKGELNKTGTGLYELIVSGITASGQIDVTVEKDGYNINPANLNTNVFFAEQAAFTGLTANGSATETTTKLTLTFDKDITGLDTDDITLSGNTGAVKGELSKTETGIYELTVTGITVSGQVDVTVKKDGYAISGNPQTTQVYYATLGILNLDITFSQIIDSAPVIDSGIVLYRVSNGGPTTAKLKVEDFEQYTNVSWRVNNTNVTGTGASFILDAANSEYNLIGVHFVTLMVRKDGVPYNKTVSFRIEY